MRIVFLNPSGELGGAETALLELLAAVRAARPSWSLTLITSAPGPLIDRASALGVSSIALPFPPALARLGEWGGRGSVRARLRFLSGIVRTALPTVAYARQLRRRLAALRPDIVHTNGFKMHILGVRCRPAAARVLWHLHDYLQSRRFTATLLRAHARGCAAIVANSESVAEQARFLLGPRVHVRAVHNAIDLDRFRPEGDRLDLDALAGLSPLAAGGIRVGLVGTFARWKGHDIFLKALAAARSRAPVRGYLIGSPIYQTEASQFSIAELRALARAADVEASVGFVGHVGDVAAAIRALDVVVHASVEPEPFGLVIAEAMGCGRPVIVSHAGGAAEIAQAGAVFHRPGSVRELADRLVELSGNPSLRASLGAAGREAALRLFSRQRLADTLVPIYESL